MLAGELNVQLIVVGTELCEDVVIFADVIAKDNGAVVDSSSLMCCFSISISFSASFYFLQ